MSPQEDLALLAAGLLLIGGSMMREPPPPGTKPQFWDRSPDGALMNVALGYILGVAAVVYALVDLIR